MAPPESSQTECPLRRYLPAATTADAMREQTTDYFSKSLSGIFDDRFAEIECSKKREAGLKPYQHKDNGETTWMRA